MQEKSLTLALTLGEVETEEMELLRQLCQAAEQELAGRLKDGLTPEDCAPAFTAAAAWLALSWLYGGQGQEGVASFSAGELTVRRGDERESQCLREQAEQVMRPYLRDGGFAFLGVPG